MNMNDMNEMFMELRNSAPNDYNGLPLMITNETMIALDWIIFLDQFLIDRIDGHVPQEVKSFWKSQYTNISCLSAAT